MAGIGFELKKLFRRKGLFATLRAYGYAGVITTGPMLLSVVLLLGMMFLCRLYGTPEQDQTVLICMITYTLLSSMMVTGFFSMAVTRYLADMLFLNQQKAIMPSFWGSNTIMLAVGCVLYGGFLLFSGAGVFQCILCYILFGAMIVNWNSMSYLTAIKDYKGIMYSFLAAVAASFISGWLLLCLGVPVIEGLLGAVNVGYGVMLVWDISLLYGYFPRDSRNKETPFAYLKWVDRFWELTLTGFFINLGMFAHIVIIWFSKIGVRVKGLFYGAPYYDVPALMAFLTIMMTTVNFVVSVEVNFFEKYRNYYALYNDKGSYRDIKKAENEMLTVMWSELWYTAVKQVLVTLLAVAFGSILLNRLPLGFNDLMHGYFRVLCIGYGFYAIGNTIVQILMYFTDYEGSLMAAASFAGTSFVLTAVLTRYNTAFYGFGFLLGSALYFLVALFRLNYFTRRLPYFLLCRQPIVSEDKRGMFTRLGLFLDQKFEEKEK